MINNHLRQRTAIHSLRQECEIQAQRM